MKRILVLINIVLLLTIVSKAEDIDSLKIYIEAGDSCMQQYNTFEALKYYQRAYELGKAIAGKQAKDTLKLPIEYLDQMPEEKAEKIIDQLIAGAVNSATVPYYISAKLADCYYKRGNYFQCSELLKNTPEDSLSHESFRQLAYSYQNQGDNGSYVYWTGRLVEHFPMDGEMVAGLTLGLSRDNQAWKGIECGLKYYLKDSTNILVNRAIADAYFMDRQFDKAVNMYERLLQQGDSTFNTLYSAGLSYSMIKDLDRAYTYLRDALFLSQMQHANCAWRLGVVCVDTKRFEEGLGYLDLANQLLLPDTTTMKAITLSKGEAYYLTEHYDKAIEAWKEHLAYNPSSIATYYNIASAYYYYLPDGQMAKTYYEKFLNLARKEETPTQQLKEMIEKAEMLLRTTNFGKSKTKK
jgi:tetratricopeptide (TPR) repeat protein